MDQKLMRESVFIDNCGYWLSLDQKNGDETLLGNL
jgi:hypothetical protein